MQGLHTNTYAVDLLKDNLDGRREWCYLSGNPAIFTYDYETIKKVKHNMHKDLIEWVWKPENQLQWKIWKL